MISHLRSKCGQDFPVVEASQAVSQGFQTKTADQLFTADVAIRRGTDPGYLEFLSGALLAAATTLRYRGARFR